MLLKSRAFRYNLKKDVEKLDREAAGLYSNETYEELKDNLISLRSSIAKNVKKQLGKINFYEGLTVNQQAALNEAYQDTELFVHMLEDATSRPEYQNDTFKNKMLMSGPYDLKHYQKARSRIVDALRTDPPIISRENTIGRLIRRVKRDINMELGYDKDFDISEYRQKNLAKYMGMFTPATGSVTKPEPTAKKTKKPRGALPKGYVPKD